MQNTVLIDWSFFVNRKKQVAALFLVGFLAAFTAYYFAVPEWQASALVQIGQVPTTAINKGAGTIEGVDSSLIESPDMVASEMTQPVFVRDVLSRLQHPELLITLLPTKFGGKGGMTVRVVTPSIIEVRVDAKSADLAAQITKAAVDTIIGRHGDITDPHLKLAREMFSALQADIQRCGQPHHEDAALFESCRYLEQNRALLLTMATYIAEPYSRPTRVIGDIYVRSNPIFPRKSMFILIGFAIGFSLNLAYMWRDRCIKQS